MWLNSNTDLDILCILLFIQLSEQQLWELLIPFSSYLMLRLQGTNVKVWIFCCIKLCILYILYLVLRRFAFCQTCMKWTLIDWSPENWVSQSGLHFCRCQYIHSSANIQTVCPKTRTHKLITCQSQDRLWRKMVIQGRLFGINENPLRDYTTCYDIIFVVTCVKVRKI